MLELVTFILNFALAVTAGSALAQLVVDRSPWNQRLFRVLVCSAATAMLLLIGLRLFADTEADLIDNTVRVITDADGTVICRPVAGVSCSQHPLVGETVNRVDLGDVTVGSDTDADGKAEWSCTTLDAEEVRFGLTFGGTATIEEVDALGDVEWFDCLETDGGGAGSDSFTLTDGTRLERIDIDGDRMPDYLRLGDGELEAVTKSDSLLPSLFNFGAVLLTALLAFAGSVFVKRMELTATQTPVIAAVDGPPIAPVTNTSESVSAVTDEEE